MPLTEICCFRYMWVTGKEPLTYYDMNLSAQDHQTFFTCDTDALRPSDTGTGVCVRCGSVGQGQACVFSELESSASYHVKYLMSPFSTTKEV